MARSGLIAACLLLAVTWAAGSAVSHKGQSGHGVEIVKNMTEFRLNNPHLKLEPLESKMEQNSNGYYDFTYKFGNLGSQDQKAAYWNNVKQTFNNPTTYDYYFYYEAPTGYEVSYAIFTVTQDTNQGSAWVDTSMGGIGTNYAKVYIESCYIEYVSYCGSFYQRACY